MPIKYTSKVEYIWHGKKSPSKICLSLRVLLVTDIS